MELIKKRILVVGLGRSGLSAARWLSREGAEVTLSDIKMEADLNDELLNEALELGIKLETGGHRKETFLESDMIILSPGVPHYMDPLKAAAERGIPVMGEMELAARLIRVPIVAVTGTNGKSTTTALVGCMLKRAGLKTFVGGNIGIPLMDYMVDDWEADYVVVEVSSFQLDTMKSLCPVVSLLLNISPDHLDRYADYEAYVQSKLKILQNQGHGQYAILNDDDERLSQFTPSGEVSVLRYGIEKKHNRQAFLHDEKIVASLSEVGPHYFDIGEFGLPGRHNLENLMGVVLVGLALDIEPDFIQETIDHFKGLPNRIERVRTFKGVDYYNDSKATNVDAATRSIISFDKPVILIAGGRHKGGDYEPLVKAAKNRVKKVILMGEAKNLLSKSFKGVIPFTLAEDMEDAVNQAFSSAESNDVVLLAPACSSFDMFSDYAHRGRVFRDAVERIQNDG
jgi:UDP-N-acetylmuramoylalanine--D-glutamate ligase